METDGFNDNVVVPNVADALDTSTEEVNAGHLRAFVERIERVIEELEEKKDDLKEIYLEAKGTGFDTKVIRKIIKIRSQDRQKRKEEEEILDLYLSALGIS